MEKQIEMPSNDCRMYDPPEKRGWNGQVCKGLNGGCPGPEYCKFYKTEKQYLDEREKAFARIRSLSFAQQSSISDTYYSSKMPWLMMQDQQKEEPANDDPC